MVESHKESKYKSVYSGSIAVQLLPDLLGLVPDHADFPPVSLGSPGRPKKRRMETRDPASKRENCAQGQQSEHNRRPCQEPVVPARASKRSQGAEQSAFFGDENTIFLSVVL